MRVQTVEGHRESLAALAKRLEAAWIGTGIHADAVGCARPFQESEDGLSQYAVCWVKSDVWDLLVHGALWVPFSEQGLGTPEVFAYDEA